MQMKKLALGSWAFIFGPYESHPWSFSDVLKYTKDVGFDGIEISGFRPHPHPDDYDTPEKCAELKKEIDHVGLGIGGYAPDFSNLSPAEVEQDVYLKEFEKALRFCENLGIPGIRVDTVSPPEHHAPDEYQRRFKKLADTWRAAAETAQNAGVVMNWEYEPGFWLNKPSEIVHLIEEVDHPNFKVMYDTSHAYMVAVVGARHIGEKEILLRGEAELAEMVMDRIGHFHLIDSDGTLHGDETSTHTPFGEGKIDFKHIMKVLEPKLNELEWWGVDYCFCPTTEEHAQYAVPYIKKLCEELS